MADLQARVNRGCAWLDKHLPDWYTYVSLRKFDMADECKCVLGQVFGPAREQTALSKRLVSVAKKLHKRVEGIYGGETSLGSGYEDAKFILVSDQFATSCGFDMGEADWNVDAWGELQRLWKIEIEARKRATVR